MPYKVHCNWCNVNVRWFCVRWSVLCSLIAFYWCKLFNNILFFFEYFTVCFVFDFSYFHVFFALITWNWCYCFCCYLCWWWHFLSSRSKNIDEYFRQQQNISQLKWNPRNTAATMDDHEFRATADLISICIVVNHVEQAQKFHRKKAMNNTKKWMMIKKNRRYKTIALKIVYKSCINMWIVGTIENQM